MGEMNGIEWTVDAQAAGRIVLNRPAHNNALDSSSAPALVRAIAEVLEAQPRVIVIESRGPIFCAGGDIRQFVQAGDRLDELVDEILDQLLPAFLQLAQASCPIVTVVGGPVGGAGVGLALCGDFVLASETMKLRTGYAAIGLSPDVGASYFLARRVGALRAQQWLMLSDAIDAQRCLAAGAVDQVHRAADLNAAAQALVERLCACAPASLAAMKRLSREGPSLSLQAYLQLEQQLLKACARTADAREGTSAFVAKRKPAFTGRSSALPTLVDLLAHNATAHADSPALILGEHVHTHALLYAAVQRQAAALAALGVQCGDRVVLIAGNRAEVLVLLGAVAWLGAMLVPLNLRLSPAEMAQQASDAAPTLMVVDAAGAPLWQAAWPEGMPGVKVAPLATVAGASIAYAGSPQAEPVKRQDAPGRAVAMLYTAAVQGHARGAVLAQSHLTSSARQIAQVWALGPSDRWLGVLPLFHAAGLGLALAMLAAGGACVLLPRFDAPAAAAAVDQHQVTVCATFAPMLGALLDAANAGGASLASLRVCMGLEPAQTIERLAARCPGADFWSAYGQAEVSSMVCLGLQRERPGAAGRAVAPSQVRIQNEAGHPVANGVQGEIAVCGPTVFLGYWDPAKQAPFKPADRWHRTGDLGHMDDEGWLWFAGRAAHKQLIKTGGENVYPAEVEQVLLEHPAVVEAFVFGRPDARWGEAVHAACALASGASVTEGELIAFVEQRVARYKRPQSIVFAVRPLDRGQASG